MGIRKIIKLFEDGNVCVTGLRGRGKDMLMSNVVVRRQKDYVSNVDYGSGEGYSYLPFVPSEIDCGKNTFKNFVTGDVKYYEYPYPDETDIYISDVGIYFPSQYCNELNKQYPYMATFSALSRHIGKCNLHFNVQNLNRAWDKLREMSDCYIMCMGCKVMFGIVFQFVRVYDNSEACQKRVIPFPIHPRLFDSREVKANIEMQRANYRSAHGTIKSHLLIYRNKSKYNTRIFRDILANGKKVENEKHS